jgi:hypothetical protein
MKAIISESGHLEVYKEGRFIQQYCPFRSPYSSCGLGCPLFVYDYTYPEEVRLYCSPHELIHEIIRNNGENKR